MHAFYYITLLASNVEVAGAIQKRLLRAARHRGANWLFALGRVRRRTEGERTSRWIEMAGASKVAGLLPQGRMPFGARPSGKIVATIS